MVHPFDLASTFSPECLLRNPLKETSEGFFVYESTKRGEAPIQRGQISEFNQDFVKESNLRPYTGD